MNPGCISPCRFPIELHSPGGPLFHVMVSTDQRPDPFQYRDFFHKRLMDKKHVRKQLYSTVRWVYPLFIRCVYIFSIKNVMLLMNVWLLLQ